MISLLLTVFLVQLAIHTISLLGAATINGVLFEVFKRLPISRGEKEGNIASLRKEVAQLYKEMSNTSAQDDFAKWAKLRRQHDKKKEEYDRITRELQDFRTSFDRAAGIARWISTTGIRYALQWWFGKQAMFWLPKGWVPYAAEWILSFPSAPLGSISINMWWIACSSMIAMASEVLIGLWNTVSGQGPVSVNEKVRIPPQTTARSTDSTAEKKGL